ncbi:MAG TPA: hypothetical protein VN281_12375, partial [Verrucomicrobiae bacterium]|nr:hypothetical protein [Verrucomicrobiae bacterium]
FEPALLALCWSMARGSERFRAALISACVALVIAWLGISRCHVTASSTVNGHVRWSLNSNWFFTASLVAGGAALTLTLWNRRKAH